MNRLILERTLEYGEARRVRRIGNYRQAAPCHSAGNQRVAKIRSRTLQQRTKISKGCIIRDSGKQGGAEKQYSTVHSRQHRLQPPLLVPSKNNQASKEKSDHKSFTQDEPVLIAFI